LQTSEDPSIDAECCLSRVFARRSYTACMVGHVD